MMGTVRRTSQIIVQNNDNLKQQIGVKFGGINSRWRPKGLSRTYAYLVK